MDSRQLEAFKRLTLTALLVALFVYVLKLASLLEAVELRWIDLMAYVDRPTLREPVTVVGITDEDFHSPRFFKGISPLEPAMLARLLERVGEHRPRAIVLDVAIHPAPWESEDRVAGRAQLYRTLLHLAEDEHVPMVLVRAPEAEPDTAQMPVEVRQPWQRLIGSRRIRWADPTLWSSEGMVRSVARWERHETNPSERPSVPGATIDVLDLEPAHHSPSWYIEEEHPMEPWHIRFSGRFVEDTVAVSPIRVSAGMLLDAPLVPGQHPLLRDRIALVGGLYQEGRDQHLTPVGEMAGVYVWGEAIASWMRHDALREPPAWITLLLECLVGVLSGLLLLRFGPGFGLLWSLLAILPLTIVFSMLTFGDRVLFVNFLPSFFAVYVHYQVELHLVIHELRHHLRSRTRLVRRLQRRVRRLERELEYDTEDDLE
jgi:CHASE2 domain-containing sensor protein